MRYFVANASYALNYDFCGNLLRGQNFLHQRRNFDQNVFIFMKEGTLYINANGVNYVLGPNQFILLKANELHYGYQVSEGKISYLWAHFHPTDEMKTFTKETALNRIIKNTIHDSEKNLYIIPEYGTITSPQRLVILFNQLLDFSRNKSLYSNQLLNYALSVLMMEVSQEFIESHFALEPPLPPSISLIEEWIRSNYYIPLSVKDIAREFGYNPNYLSALFKRITKNTLVNYIHKTKIEMSKPLLCSYNHSIKETAYACGFTDEKYYMKTFKKFEGMTPTQYRKNFSDKYIT